jgi:hypothetical protein
VTVICPATGLGHTITVKHADDGLAPLAESTLALHCRATDPWVMEPASAASAATDRVTATPDHFSLWAVWGKWTRYVYLPLVLRSP